MKPVLNGTEMGTSEFKHQEANPVLTNPNTCKPSNSAGTQEAQGQTQVVSNKITARCQDERRC